MNYNCSETSEIKPSHKPKPTYLSNQYHNDQDNKQTKCSFCGEEGHVLTNGPNGSSLIQYFACRKFTELNPGQRFRELRTKGLCHQCLYPGANQSDGKHAIGKCQSLFTCKHKSHERFPIKKHVLVCQEHASSNENQKLLEEYKNKCILNRKVSLEEFLKDIKL